MVKSVKLHIFAFLSLSVAVQSFVLTYSTPQQCGDVELAWTKPSTSAAQLVFPLQLHILPFDSTAVSQQIPGWNASMMSGSAVLSFKFNLTSGTDFLLAVTDDTGKGVGPVSDVKTVATSFDTSCLSTGTPSPGHFQVITTPNSSDCPSINVEWDGTVQSSRPTVLAFSPGQDPVDMDPQSSPIPTERSVLSTGTFTSMSQVVVLFRDGDTTGRTSQFLTVGGTDHIACSSLPESGTMTRSNATAICNPHSTLLNLKGAGRVFGGTGAAVVGLAIVLFVVFEIRRRLRRPADNPGSQEAQSNPHDPAPVSPPKSATSETFHVVEDGGKAQGSAAKSTPPTPTTSDQGDAHASPQPVLPAVTVPLTRRRSWTSRISQGSRTTRSQPSMTTDESIFLQFAGASIFPSPSSADTDGTSTKPGNGSIRSVLTQQGYGDAAIVSRPDSPTLPDTKSMKSLRIISGLPATPKSYIPRSSRSQRSEKREHYLKLDPPPLQNTRGSGERLVSTPSLHSPSSWRSHMSFASRVSRTQKDH